jgi:hypothetical protein
LYNSALLSSVTRAGQKKHKQEIKREKHSMKKKIIIAIAVAMALVIVLSVSSCGNIAGKVAEKAMEKVVENAVGSDANIDVEGEGVKVSNESGEVQLGGDAKVPEGWPAEAPAYPDIKVTFASKSKDDNGKDAFGLFAEVTKGTVKDVYEWYKSKMSGWETTSDNFGTSDGNDSFTLIFNNGKYEALVMAGSDGKVISFTMTIAEQSNN